MRIIKKIDQIKKEIKNLNDKLVGFVPTMGYLHEGHLSLVRQCKKENDITIVSIYVNPTQFGADEDFERYPRDVNEDEKLLKELGVDILFIPDSNEIYPENYSTYVEVESLGKVLCGKSRPAHFRGVTTIVLKLFNMATPVRTYFGQKDAQQAIIIKRMVRDLNLDVDVRIMPIIRDTDGLALSSRNKYLSEMEREAALHLPGALQRAKLMVDEGVEDTSRILDEMRGELKKSELVEIEYVEIVTLNKLDRVNKIDKQNTLVAAAIRVGKTRLIDNFALGEI